MIILEYKKHIFCEVNLILNSSQVGIKILKSRYTEEWNDVSVEVVNNNILENYDISMICNETAIYLEI